MKSKVIVGRKWNSPNITVAVTADDIGIEMSLSDFIHALSLESGNPAALLTVSGLERSLQKAAETVVSGMKAESARAM